MRHEEEFGERNMKNAHYFSQGIDRKSLTSIFVQCSKMVAAPVPLFLQEPPDDLHLPNDRQV